MQTVAVLIADSISLHTHNKVDVVTIIYFL